MRLELLRLIGLSPRYTNFDDRNGVALFSFGMVNTLDGIAAKVCLHSFISTSQVNNSLQVWSYDDTNPHLTVLANERRTTQAKRAEINNATIPVEDSPYTFEDLQEFMRLGLGKEVLVHANGSSEDDSEPTFLANESPMIQYGFDSVGLDEAIEKQETT